MRAIPIKSPRVISDPEILGGTPVFIGTRVPVRIIFEHLGAGDSLEVLLSVVFGFAFWSDDLPATLAFSWFFFFFSLPVFSFDSTSSSLSPSEAFVVASCSSSGVVFGLLFEPFGLPGFRFNVVASVSLPFTGGSFVELGASLEVPLFEF